MDRPVVAAAFGVVYNSGPPPTPRLRQGLTCRFAAKWPLPNAGKNKTNMSIPKFETFTSGAVPVSTAVPSFVSGAETAPKRARMS